ncbi:hypothetical protein MPER_11861, partial [Moniliophthora perniciosa FA553]
HEDRSPHPHTETAPDLEPTTSTNKEERETPDFKHGLQSSSSMAGPGSDGAANATPDPVQEAPVNAPPPATFSTNSSSADRDGTSEEISKVDTVATISDAHLKMQIQHWNFAADLTSKLASDYIVLICHE